MDVESYIKIIDTYAPAVALSTIPNGSLRHLGVSDSEVEEYNAELVTTRDLLQVPWNLKSDFLGFGIYRISIKVALYAVTVSGAVAFISIFDLFQLPEFAAYARSHMVSALILGASTIIPGIWIFNRLYDLEYKRLIRSAIIQNPHGLPMVGKEISKSEIKTRGLLERLEGKIDFGAGDKYLGFISAGARQMRKTQTAYFNLRANCSTLQCLQHAFATAK